MVISLRIGVVTGSSSRIIAKPGQSMAFRQGQLYRDDRPVDASYAKNRKIKDFQFAQF